MQYRGHAGDFKLPREEQHLPEASTTLQCSEAARDCPLTTISSVSKAEAPSSLSLVDSMYRLEMFLLWVHTPSTLPSFPPSSPSSPSFPALCLFFSARLPAFTFLVLIILQMMTMMMLISIWITMNSNSMWEKKNEQNPMVKSRAWGKRVLLYFTHTHWTSTTKKQNYKKKGVKFSKWRALFYHDKLFKNTFETLWGIISTSSRSCEW